MSKPTIQKTGGGSVCTIEGMPAEYNLNTQYKITVRPPSHLTLPWHCRLEFVFCVNIATSITMVIIAQRFERDDLTAVPIATAPYMRVCCCWHAMCR